MQLRLWLEYLGRFHPLLVHFPIALLFFAALTEVTNRFRGRPFSRGGPEGWLLAGGTLSAVLAAALGWMAAAGRNDFDATDLLRHRWLGTALAVQTLVGGIVYGIGLRRNQPKTLAVGRWIILLSVLLLVPVGHYGAVLVHGRDYLSWPVSKPTLPPGSAATLSDADLGLRAHALLRQRCFECHGTRKHKGGLRLDSLEAAMRGGEEGPAIVPFHADLSLAIERVALPEDDEDAMPAKGDPLTAEEQELLRRWITQGAPWSAAP